MGHPGVYGQGGSHGEGRRCVLAEQLHVRKLLQEALREVLFYPNFLPLPTGRQYQDI